jgi:hypothetical protein
MCHGKQFRRADERSEYARGERLWDLFYRETEHNAPPVPIAEREERDAAPEEILTAGTRGAGDRH